MADGFTVWHGTQEKYQIFDSMGGRFNSEFGMIAFPHMSTIEYFLENEKDKHPQSQVMDFHNKADGHERRLATYLVENLRMATDLEVCCITVDRSIEEEEITHTLLRHISISHR